MGQSSLSVGIQMIHNMVAEKLVMDLAPRCSYMLVQTGYPLEWVWLVKKGFLCLLNRTFD